MPSVLPSSLSPHICILPSPDLDQLLQSSSLPPLPNILQSFSPLPDVTTRTTSLVSIPHTSFALRFSDLAEIEHACNEDEDERAVRMLDWISARISKRCAKWVHDIERLGGDLDSPRTPWWDELRRCAEGDHVPAKTEGWNHPVAVILAVSTTAPNPLQAINALHSRAIQFPPWVDSTFLRYTLIVHPKNSPLSDEEAGALFNAVKKQYGLHSYLLPLNLPATPPPPVPVPALMPRLPPQPSPDASVAKPPNPDPNEPTSPTFPTVLNTLRMEENDIKHTARFTREFVVMSLVPWMEKCVVDWNETFSSNRRLPSRLFSSTRRLFGSPSPSPPTHGASSSISSLPGRASPFTLSNGVATPPSQQRRLAEFSTILGDFKLAVTVWESLRKENKGGSDILPLLLSPSPTLLLHASTALSNIHSQSTDPPPHAQLRALLYAVRWEAGISTSDLLSNVLEGERWIVWAAGNAEEAPSALLLAHAALLSTKKQARRRAAFWYVDAANRLEKCGIKPLTMYFLRKAKEQYKMESPKSLSPSFWESEGKSPNSLDDFGGIISGIEHPLGRLLYTTGDVAGAVRVFLGLLRGPSKLQHPFNISSDNVSKWTESDKAYLDDFRVAYAHLSSTEPDKIAAADLQIPIRFCVEGQTKIRFPTDSVNDDARSWDELEETWRTFWKSRGGKEGLVDRKKACTGELIWVDLVLRNPLDAELNLTEISIVVHEKSGAELTLANAFVEVQTIDEVILGPRESRTIPVSLKSQRATSLVITSATYNFLSYLRSTEHLASRGRRLHGTAAQRQKAAYAPDIPLGVDIAPADHKLLVSFVEDSHLHLIQGETKVLTLSFSNAGLAPVEEIWMVGGDDGIWLHSDDDESESTPTGEVIRSQNSLKPQEPLRLPVTRIEPGESLNLPVVLHAERAGTHELNLMFVFREGNTGTFHCARLTWSYEVQPLFEVVATAEPSRAQGRSYVVNVDVTNRSISSTVKLSQITTLSPLWRCGPLTDSDFGTVPPHQCVRLLLEANPWQDGVGSQETLDFLSEQLGIVLRGEDVKSSDPPSIDLLCSHISKFPPKSVQETSMRHSIHSNRRQFTAHNISQVHPYISSMTYPSIFPLYNPASVDILIFWEIPTQQRFGYVSLYGLTLGARHGVLQSMIEEAESAKVKRSMYTETHKENLEVLDAIKSSEWNMEMDPVVLSIQQPDITSHDFSKGPCRLSIAFNLRNHSLTHGVRCTLRMSPEPTSSSPNPSSPLPAPYFGRLTFRDSIPPCQTVTIRPKVWISQPGTYSLDGWILETEVPSPVNHQARQQRYRQEAPSREGSCLIIHDSRT